MSQHITKAGNVTIFNLNCANQWDVKVEEQQIILSQMGDHCGVLGESFVLNFGCSHEFNKIGTAMCQVSDNFMAEANAERVSRQQRIKELEMQLHEERVEFDSLFGAGSIKSGSQIEVLKLSELPAELREHLGKLFSTP